MQGEHEKMTEGTRKICVAPAGVTSLNAAYGRFTKERSFQRP